MDDTITSNHNHTLCTIHTEITNKLIDLNFINTIGLQYPDCGAISTFLGITRNNYQNKQVIQLEYEAYIPMALKHMYKICENIINKYNNLSNTVNTTTTTTPELHNNKNNECFSCQHKQSIEQSKYHSHQHNNTLPSSDNQPQGVPKSNSVQNEEPFIIHTTNHNTHATEGLRYIHVIHRLGIVPVGEVSIAIVAMSPHRTSAINGVHDIIDNIKATVPIWKKEIYANNTDYTLTNSESSSRKDGVWKENSECIWKKE